MSKASLISDRRISVWEFEDAPEEYRRLADLEARWIALVPRDVWKQEQCEIAWAAPGSYFGQRDVQEIRLDSGDVLLIGVEE